MVRAGDDCDRRRGDVDEVHASVYLTHLSREYFRLSGVDGAGLELLALPQEPHGHSSQDRHEQNADS